MNGFRIDRELRRDFWAPAGFAFVSASLSVSPRCSVALDLTLEHVRPAPRDEEFFNRRLGSTTLLAFSLAVFVHFEPPALRQRWRARSPEHVAVLAPAY